MTEDRKKLLEKLKYDKENLIKIKKKYGRISTFFDICGETENDFTDLF